ncbi:Crp/Fnr family transcriptional regulator [Chromohalobacter beijerinckii]|uniref:Crp/Fnr family transcriptional regulator n=1 Tax=Chromohalobacter beijerinckii TaxID=86179 RepID=A0ABV8XEU1_9GAMM|nr:Crp/Fnr family transcriptional regulator [Chromohalobacter beijerinckii]MCK0764684.1 Crp/Fnr family transcriptional regulator [Chromohalobacter beijerinckii]
MSENDSCIIRHFRHYADLSDSDEALLDSLEREPREVERGEALWQTDDPAGRFCTLSQGWAYSFRDMEDGSRQILEIYLPGDVIGLREFAFQERLAGVMMIDDGVVCDFPHRRLLEVFRESFTLSMIFFALSSQQQALLTERLVNLARRSARQKVAHLIYEMYLRLQRIMPYATRRFRLPLSQQQLGDALGLTSVHISRTLSGFREDGLLIRERQWVELLDPDAVASEAEFAGRYLRDGLGPISGE